MDRTATMGETAVARRRRLLLAGRALAALALIAVIALATPVPARAWDLPDVKNTLFEFINNLVASILCSELNLTVKIVSEGIDLSTVNVTFSQLLATSATGGVPAVYTLVKTVANTVVQPCAYTVLSVTTLVQFLVIAKRMDQGTPELATLREVFTLFCWLAIMSFLIAHAFDLVREAYNLMNVITSATVKAIGKVGSVDALKDVSFTVDKMGIDGTSDTGALLLCALIGIIAVVFSMFTVVTSFAMAFARGLEVYLLAAFSPLPFAFLSLDATRQWGIGYVKQFLTVCLQGVMILLLLAFFPVIMSSLVSGSFSPSAAKAFVAGDKGGFDYVTAVLRLCAGLYVMNKSMTKTGQIAANVFGG